MTIDSAIACYVDLTERIFSLTSTGRDEKFNALTFENAIKTIVKDERMMDKQPSTCKTYASYFYDLTTRRNDISLNPFQFRLRYAG